jgi:anti-anti-sigma factor
VNGIAGIRESPALETVDRSEGLTVLALSGGHDLSTAPQLAGALRAAAARGDSIQLDLTRTTFADAAVLRAVVSGAEALEPGRSLVLEVALGGAVERLLEASGFALNLPEPVADRIAFVVRETARAAEYVATGRGAELSRCSASR